MKAFALALFLCASLFAQLYTPPPPFSNSAIESMVKQGVPTASVIATIMQAPDIDLYIDTYAFNQIVDAGATQAEANQILEAMRQRKIHRSQSVAPAPAVAMPVVATGAAPVAPAPEPDSLPYTSAAYPTVASPAPSFSAAASGKKRVFVGDRKMFLSSAFAIGSTSTTATGKSSNDSNTAFRFPSGAEYNFAVDMMKSIHDLCPGLDITDDPDTADYFVRLDLDPEPINHAKVAAFNRSRTLVFADKWVSLARTVKNLCKTVTP